MAIDDNLTVSRVRPGAVLAQEITRSDGSCLLGVGHRLTPEDIKNLKTLGIQEIVVAEDAASSANAGNVLGAGRGKRTVDYDLQDAFQPGAVNRYVADDCTRQYSQEAISQAQKCFSEASENYQRLIHRLTCNLPVPAASFTNAWTEFQKVAKNDTAVALKTLADHNVDLADQPQLTAIMTQSVMRAALSSVIASESGLDPSTCSSIATAAMLHDVALLDEMRPIVEKLNSGRLTHKTLLHEHSVLSSQLFSGLDGISDSIVNMIREVHEQIDGTGFPFNLKAEEISFGGRILNVVDAYVQMVSEPSKAPYFPADAMAHIVFHTKHEAFDREVVCHLLSAASIYPVGYPVELDDSTAGTVYRSVGSDFTSPVVISNESNQVLDLRKEDRYIVRPVQDKRQLRSRRIKMSTMSDRLWLDSAVI